jgi:CheY-like chemotaxis protein
MNSGPNHPSSHPGGGGGGRRHRRGRRGKRGSGGGQQQHKGQQQQGQGNRQGPQSNPGIYTAPMDHNYRAALSGGQPQNNNGGGGRRQGRNQRGGRAFIGTSYVQPEPEPLPVAMNENAVTRIFAFVDDLFFLAKINEISRKLNIKVEFVKSEKDVFARVEENGGEPPTLVIVDLNNANIKPLTVIAKIKKEYKKQTNIVGFLSHVQGELKVKAQEAGCDMVVPRSAFSQNLPSLLRRHAADELDEEVV